MKSAWSPPSRCLDESAATRSECPPGLLIFATVVSPIYLPSLHTGWPFLACHQMSWSCWKENRLGSAPRVIISLFSINKTSLEPPCKGSDNRLCRRQAVPLFCIIMQHPADPFPPRWKTCREQRTGNNGHLVDTWQWSGTYCFYATENRYKINPKKTSGKRNVNA